MRTDENGHVTNKDYLRELKRAGAIGAIVGEGLAGEEADESGSRFKSLLDLC